MSLVPESVLEGVVHDTSGAPVSACSVSAICKDPKQGRMVVTDSRGRYRISNLSAGDFDLQASSDASGQGKAKLTIASQATMNWSPSLDPGPTISGRVVDTAGEPCVDWRVTGLGERGWCKPTFTDADGNFELIGCTDARYEVRVRKGSGFLDVPAARQEAVHSGSKELLLTVPLGSEPTAWIQGSLLPPAGRVITGLKVRIEEKESFANHIYPVDPKTGRFEIGPLPAKTYSLESEFEGTEFVPVSFGQVKLSQHERKDVGTRTLVMAVPGEFRVQGDLPEYLRAMIYSVRPREYVSHGRLKDGRLRLYHGLAAGRYVLVLTHPEIVSVEHAFEFIAGQANRVDVTVKKGHPFRLEVEGIEDLTECVVTVAYENGQRVRFGRWLNSKQSEVRVQLPDGSTEIEVRTKDGRSASCQVRGGTVERSRVTLR